MGAITFGHLARINQLPTFEWLGRLRIVRGFEPRPVGQMKELREVPLREGITPEIAATKTGIPVNRLGKFGIFESSIYIATLASTLKNEIPEKLQLRGYSTKRTPDNALVAIASRLGAEAAVLQPFDIAKALSPFGSKYEIVSLLGGRENIPPCKLVLADFNASHNIDVNDARDFSDPAKYYPYAARLAHQLYPKDKSWAIIIIKNLAMLFSQDNRFDSRYMSGARQELSILEGKIAPE